MARFRALNYDKSITPTLLFHAGVGYQRFHNPDSSPAGSLQYDAVSGIGFNGSSTSPSGFPRLNGLTTSFGPSNANSYFDGTLHLRRHRHLVARQPHLQDGRRVSSE